MMHGHEIRNAGGLWKLDGLRKLSPPRASRRRAALRIQFGLLTSRNVTGVLDDFLCGIDSINNVNTFQISPKIIIIIKLQE